MVLRLLSTLTTPEAMTALAMGTLSAQSKKPPMNIRVIEYPMMIGVLMSAGGEGAICFTAQDSLGFHLAALAGIVSLSANNPSCDLRKHLARRAEMGDLPSLHDHQLFHTANDRGLVGNHHQG